MLDLVAYQTFLKQKVVEDEARAVLEFDFGAVHDSTKPHQHAVVRWALAQRTALIAASFGLGKTQICLEIARLLMLNEPDKKCLIALPLGVRHQFFVDAKRLGLAVQYVWDDESLANSKTSLVLTNYERLRDGNIDTSQHSLAGIFCDEGNVMVSLENKTSDVFGDILKNVPYKFIFTATPAPNDYKEIIYYAHQLGVMDYGQALTRFFMRNPDKAGDLRIQPQREAEFWLWVSRWALFLHLPSDLGFDDSEYILPELQVHWHRVDASIEAFDMVDSRGQRRLFFDSNMGVSEMARSRRQTRDARIGAIQSIMDTYSPETHWLLWHDLESERDALERKIPDCVSIYGNLELEERERRIGEFSNGGIRVLATKPQLSGSGCNFQRHCAHNIFIGVSFKFRDIIQAIHRTLRFQQPAEIVHVHFVYSVLDDQVVDNLKKKWKQHDALVKTMREIIKKHGLSHRSIEEAMLRRYTDVERIEKTGKRFALFNNDCVLELDRMPSNSVGLIVSSYPFSKHYEYSPSNRDFGFNKSHERFMEQLDFLLPNLLRVLKPGRVAAIHLKDLIEYSHQTASGFMQQFPFSDLVNAAMIKHGFLFEGRRYCTTDVVRENNTTNRLGYSEMKRDSSKMGSGLPEQILLYRKAPSDNATARADEPVTKGDGETSLSSWQLDASAQWQSNGNVIVPSDSYNQVQYLLDFIRAHGYYDFDAHVARMLEKERRNRLPKKFLSDPPDAKGNQWVWDDLNFMTGLNSFQSWREQEKHICPLPFDIVNRLIKLYSNKDDVVLDPFGGLMTVPYCAIKLGRIGWGVELSPQYFNDGVYYCEQAEIEAGFSAPTLFDLGQFDTEEGGEE